MYLVSPILMRSSSEAASSPFFTSLTVVLMTWVLPVLNTPKMVSYLSGLTAVPPLQSLKMNLISSPLLEMSMSEGREAGPLTVSSRSS